MTEESRSLLQKPSQEKFNPIATGQIWGEVSGTGCQVERTSCSVAFGGVLLHSKMERFGTFYLNLECKDIPEFWASVALNEEDLIFFKDHLNKGKSGVKFSSKTHGSTSALGLVVGRMVGEKRKTAASRATLHLETLDPEEGVVVLKIKAEVLRRFWIDVKMSKSDLEFVTQAFEEERSIQEPQKQQEETF